MGDLLADPAVTALNVVTTPEEMPVHETVELVGRVRESLDVPLGAVVVNRVLPELFTQSDELAFEALRQPAAVAALEGAVGPGIADVLTAAELAVTLRRTRAAHLAHLREAVELPLLYLPELFIRAQGMRVTRMVADSLGEELGL
jgi:anion-transporting  ArsA/GET3 family ATPase